MKDPSTQNTGGQSTWAMASQWGMALVAYTCVLGFAGYYIGDHVLANRYWALGLMLLGLVVGFSAAIYQIFKTSQQIQKAYPNKPPPLPDEPKEE